MGQAGEAAAMLPGRGRGADEVRALVALAIVRGGRLLLVAGAQDRWQRETGYTLVPLELPGDALTDGRSVEDVVAELGCRSLGGRVGIRSSRWVYTPDGGHVVSRRPPLTDEDPAPLMLLTRFMPRPLADRANASLRPVTVRILLAEYLEEPADRGVARFELPFQVARAVVRGMPLAELLARDGVRAWPTGVGAPLPQDALVYLPSEYGERYLLRVAARHGEEAIGVVRPDERA